MLKNLETMSTDVIVKKQAENRAQAVNEDCVKSAKTVMDISHNQCVLCDLNFIGIVIFLSFLLLCSVRNAVSV